MTDIAAHAHDRQEHRDLVAAHQKLSRSRVNLAATTYAKALTANHRDVLQASVASTMGELATAEKTLSGTNAEAFFQGVGIGTLQTCLGGVQSSYQQISAHDDNQAAQDIAAVSGACLTLAGGAGGGLVYPFDFPDPGVILVGDTYFAYATNSVAGTIQIIESTDLVHWNAAANALPSLPGWATPGATWAPAVALINGAFVLYYAANVAGPGGGEECISAATAIQPQGPFSDTSSAPLECQPSLGGSLDPSPFVDADGRTYLVWKSNGGAGPATIWSEQLDAAGTGFATNATPAQLLVPSQAWEAGVVEAPDLVTSGGRYFLVYSGNNWNSAKYAVGVSTCTGPQGPCTKPLSQPILSSGADMQGPGGESVFTDTSGSFWIAFDAFLPKAVGYPHNRDLYLRRLDLSGATPVVEQAG
ncbi:MAG: family 43 glycosylhydrolase [Acidimicrobiales bacterium]|nr:family 43 glycosylhydrolase [Acidimicrobiales bacterium]